MSGCLSPAVPVEMALAASVVVAPAATFLAALAASAVSGYIWYRVGRGYGRSVLGVPCRISLESRPCIRRTGEVFARRGARAPIAAKFAPGPNRLAPPGILSSLRSV